MITTKDISVFYKEYYDNLSQEALLEAYFAKASTKEEWVRRMKERAIKLRELYIENEALLDKYVRPLLEKKEELTEELVSAISKELLKHYMTEYDALAVVKMAQLIEPYAEEHHMVNEHIIAITTLGLAYQSVDLMDFVKRAHDLYMKLDRYLENYDEISDDVIDAFATSYVWRSASLGNILESRLSDVLALREKDLNSILNIKEYVSRRNEQTGGKGEQAIRAHFIYGIVAKINRMFEPNGEEEALKEALDIMEPIFLTALEEAGDKYKVRIDLTYIYFKLCWLNGRFSLYEFISNSFRYYTHIYNDPENAEWEKKPRFNDSNIFKTMTLYLPNLFECISKLDREDEERKKLEEIVGKMIDEYIDFLPLVPKGKSDAYICNLLRDSVNCALPIISYEKTDEFALVYNYVIQRDMDVSVHSYMVAKLSMLILENVIDCKPELVVGCLGCKDAKEVVSRRAELIRYIYRGALIHDLGKINVSFVTKKQSRRISDGEFAFIKLHPSIGAQTASLSPTLEEYTPIILGHHKSYDDNGYPYDYKIRENPNTFLVNIVQICDCLDAATDSVGRIYAKEKNSYDVIEEFKVGSGTRYNPDLVDMIASDEKLQKEIYELTTDGRIEVCHEVFATYLEENNAK